MRDAGRTGVGKIGALFGPKHDAAARSPSAPAWDRAAEQAQALRLLHDFEQSGQGWFWSTDADGRLCYISACIAQAVGVPREQLVGQALHAVFVLDRDDDDTTARPLPLILSTHKTFAKLAVRAASSPVETCWAISGRPQVDAGGNFAGYHGNGTDVTLVRQEQREASRGALYDTLTGLPNRQHMTTRLHAMLATCRSAKRSCALIAIDLDRFKIVNDTLGLAAGDELLKQVADRLVRVMPGSAELGRIGGNEFQIILPDIDDRGRLGEIAKKAIDMISQPYAILGSRCIIGASVGVGIAPYDGIESGELIRSADLALCSAKSGGRGQFRFYSSELHSEAERRRKVEDDLRDALSRDQIHLAYQPIVDVQTDKVVAVEALMRWDHPELGPISPAVFIPIAEESTLIVELGEWALRKACSDVAQLPGQVRVAVNVSARQFATPGFQAVVAQALTNTGLSPDMLELEVTESIFLAEDEVTERMFKALKALGVRLSLDDFGTGYSSLGYLKKAAFDKIKIDQCFIRGITQPGNRNVAIIKSIVSLAEGFAMTTTAEGIEAHDELMMMRDLGVEQIQGFIYSKALPFDQVQAALADGSWVIEPNGPSRYRQERITVLRKVGVIHEDHRYEVTMRNLSSSGCLIEGLSEVPADTQFVVDFGEGQLAVATVRRGHDVLQGLEFELPLVDDGAGGLCTRNRVSPYVLAAAGMPLAALPSGSYPLAMAAGAPTALGFSLPHFAQPSDTQRKAARGE